MVLLFGAASFLSAGLLFLVQPMVGKLVLPMFGGSPSVWNTSMLFFQTMLLAGYGYAHVSTRLLGLRRQPVVHVFALLLPLLVLPIGLPPGARPPEGVMPALWLLYVLTVMIGAPFLLVSTSGPLLQRWFSATDHRLAGDPYFLYAAGNAGSLLALLAYPFLVEPSLSLEAQAGLWTAGYAVSVLLALGCVLALRRRRAPPGDLVATAATPGHLATSAPPASGRPLELRRQLRWVLLAFIPSSLMLGVTTFMSTDIAAFPLLWVVPLALYVLTFVVAFGTRRARVALIAGRVLPALVVAVALTMVEAVSLPTALELALHLSLFTAVGLLAHGRLAADRPPPVKLTYFYLLISSGGALGGLFNGLLAPVVFNQVLEYPLVIVVSVFLLVGLRRPKLPSRPVRLPRRAVEATVVVGVPGLLQLAAERLGSGAEVLRTVALLAACGVVAVVAARRPLAFGVGMAAILAGAITFMPDALATERTFFGVERVEVNGDRHVLIHGTTIHGWQDRRPGHRLDPQHYYHPSGPIGDVFAAYGSGARADEVAITGLGTGALAAYGRAGQAITFYEIDHAIVDIARNPALFSFLRDSPATVKVIVGDARLALADAPDDHYGIMVLDAFSSDAVPVHLLTSEAVELYRSKLAPGGILVFHISNRYLDLEPVLAGIAARQRLVGAIRTDSDSAPDKLPTNWVVLAESPLALDPLTSNPKWHTLAVEPGREIVWTDDFSNVVRVFGR